MATTVNKYRVWCSTDSKYVETWNDVEPTECPENNGHSIDTTKTAIIESVSEEFPLSDIDERKVSVHPSYKPSITDGSGQSYAVWTGCGDDMSKSPHGIGEGDLLHFCLEPQTGSPLVKQVIEKDIEFDPAFGRVWLHEAYLSTEGGSKGDYIESDIMAYATPLQPVANKIVYVDQDNWIKYAVGSPNPATHGWAGTPVLIPRTYSKDGDWDYDGANLTPNLAGTGEYKLSAIERPVHRFVSKIPCAGTNPYFSMTSDETTELRAGYFIRIRVVNDSNTEWHVSVIMEIYRQQTLVP